MTPKLHEVWQTKAGNQVLIVINYDHGKNGELKMLWWDEIDQELTISDLHNRLSHKLPITPKDWFQSLGIGECQVKP